MVARKALKKAFGTGSQHKHPDSDSLFPSLDYLNHVVTTIVGGHKPVVDPTSPNGRWIADLFRKMEHNELIPENWDQFILKPGQDPTIGMARGDISISVLCAPLAKNGEHWAKTLSDSQINNFHVLGCDPAFRYKGLDADQSSVAECFILPEGDFDTVAQFMKLLRHNRDNSAAPKLIVADNRTGFWDGLQNQLPEEKWSELGVSFANSTADAVQFFTKRALPENLLLNPIKVDHPLAFREYEANPLILIGTGNAKKISDFLQIKNKYAPLLECRPFQTIMGSFHEPPEVSLTCLGNAREKMEEMLNVVYASEESADALIGGYKGRPIVLVANDTGARVRLVDETGEAVLVNWVECPELQKARGFIAEGKEQWWPGPEIKMVASAMGKSQVFYSEVLKAIKERVERETGKALTVQYIDDSVYLFGVLGETRKDVKFFATKGMHKDGMVFSPSPLTGEIDFENFSVPLEENPEGKTRADLGSSALLHNSSTLAGITTFLNIAQFPKPVSLEPAFQKNGAGARVFNLKRPVNDRYYAGTIGDFGVNTRSSGFEDFKRIAANYGIQRRRKVDLGDIEGFDKYLASVDMLILGGSEDVNLTPIQRAAFYSRVMVALQTNHPSLSGKPVVIVDDEKMDPVLKWVLSTQDFLYNHKLFGMRSEECFTFADSLRIGLGFALRELNEYVRPVSYHSSYAQTGNDERDRPSVAILGSASTYDPHHIGLGHQFGTEMAKRDLHLRHGGCSRGVVGGTADAFASYRDEHGKGRMTGVQCHGLLRLEGMNEGNDCVKIYDGIGGRKLDIYQSDIPVFLAGGWGTYEEFFDLLAMMDAGKAKPHRVIIVDYPFDSAPDESTYQPLNSLLSPEDVERYHLTFVESVEEAVAQIDQDLPKLNRLYAGKPKMGPEGLVERKLG